MIHTLLTPQPQSDEHYGICTCYHQKQKLPTDFIHIFDMYMSYGWGTDWNDLQHDLDSNDVMTR
jgi:hypothetical protein